MNNITPLAGRNTHTQDSGHHPVFIWLIAAVRRDCPSIVAVIHHIPAESEQAARRTLAKEHVCFFAGRLPIPRTGIMDCLTPSHASNQPTEAVRHA